MVQVFMVPQDEIVPMWPLVRPWVLDALEYTGGRASEASVLFDLATQKNTLWVVYSEEKGRIVAFFTLKVVKYTGRQLLSGELLGGGDLEDWAGAVCDTLRRYAKDTGCDGVEMYGRAGWERVLPKLGWRKAMVLFEMDMEQKVNADGQE